MRKLSPDTAEFIAKYWSLSTLIELSVEVYVRYLKDILSHFDILGIYEDGNDKHPVSWLGVRPGNFFVSCIFLCVFCI